MPSTKVHQVQEQLTKGVRQIHSTESAFAALKEDGSVVTWGNSDCGGDSSEVWVLGLVVFEAKGAPSFWLA